MHSLMDVPLALPLAALCGPFPPYMQPVRTAHLPEPNTVTHAPLFNYSQCRSGPHPRQARTVRDPEVFSVREDITDSRCSTFTPT
ncbi:hypothetical protein BJV77DRAFT_1014044 [Russula vinacea]|nr:hypothetical protein BJV77DRAFT_1014044 [Russula vinacea]